MSHEYIQILIRVRYLQGTILNYFTDDIWNLLYSGNKAPVMRQKKINKKIQIICSSCLN